MAAEQAKVDPMYQFTIEPLAGSGGWEIAGYNIAFTNSALWMLITTVVLFLFVLMLLSTKDNDQYALKLNVPRGLAVAITGLLMIQVLTAFMDPTIRFGAPGDYPVERIQEIGSITLIGQLLFTEFVLPFEVISILLLVAVIGAVIIAKRRVP